MIPVTIVRRRVEAQGFHGLDDVALAEVGPWLRWAPALCAVFMAAGTILASPPVLWSLGGIALLGAFLPNHPFDYLYNHAVRRLTRTRALPPHGPQRRFACGIATAWLAATGLAFEQGAATLGYVLGVALTLVAAIVGATHFCIPSLVYNTLFGRRHSSAGAAARRVSSSSCIGAAPVRAEAFELEEVERSKRGVVERAAARSKG